MSVSCPQAYLLAAGTWLLELLDCPGDSDHQGQSQLGPQKEGHPPWEKPLWLQQLPGPPESAGPVGE